MAINERKLQMILNNHAEVLNEYGQNLKEQEKTIGRLEDDKDNLFDLVQKLDRRINRCEEYTQAVDYLLQQSNKIEAPQGANRRRRVIVKSCGQVVEVMRV